MNWYKDKQKEWLEIINVVSSEIKKDTTIIEKDLIQSLFLYRLSQYDFPFVFKGGTSLSKAYGLIDRFSEDIDLSSSKKLTASEKRLSKKIILETAANIGLTLDNEDTIKSKYDYNRYVFKYISLFTLKKLESIVETNFYSPVYPTCNHKINCFITEFCRKNEIILPVQFDAYDFEMCIQTLDRTFVDKVFAICDYRLENMWDRDSRHLYDIAKILPYVSVNDGLKDLIINVRTDRMKSKNNPSAQSRYDINSLLKEIVESRFFESDYNNLTKKLLYEKYTYDDAIRNGILKVLEINIF